MELIPLTGVAFDMDGTLIDTEPRNRVMWARLFDAHGAPYDDALLGTFTGRRGREVLAELLHLFPGREVEDLFQQAIARENDPDLPHAAPVPGAVELVRELHAQGVPISVVTSGQRGYAELTLTGLGVLDLFDVVVTADDVTDGKPHPEGFLAAARALGLDPAGMVGFEDAPAGVAAVKAAGMTCVGVSTTHPAAGLAAADRVVPNLKEIDVLPGPALRIAGS